MFCLDCDHKLSNKPNKKQKYRFTGYCKKCVVRHKNKQVANIEKTCPVCKKQFLAKTKRKKFCSQQCNSISKSVRFNNPEPKNLHPLLKTKGYKQKKGKVKNCGLCHKEIYVLPTYVKQHKTHFCCKEHAYKFWKKTKTNHFYVNCKICSKSIKVTPSSEKHRPRKTCSKICRRKWLRQTALKRRKQLGYTKHQLDRLQRYSIEAKEWRKAVFERDDYTCQFCYKRGSYIEADHIKPWAYFPKLRFSLDNGRTLCRPCHDKTKISCKALREKWKEYL